MAPIPRPIAERFWEKVAKTGDCWLWTAHRTLGYGQFTLARGRHVRAHRYSWTLAHGEIPTGLDVLHRCDVRACVRPDHLFLGTQADNNRDMVAKGRHAHLAGNGRAKLSPEQVQVIRHARGHVSQSKLAALHGVSKTAIRHIQKGRNWSALDHRAASGVSSCPN